MQSSLSSVVSELFAQLLAALFGVAADPPPIEFERPAADELKGGAVACTEGAFGSSRGEGARDVVCLAEGGFVSVLATDGSAERRVSNTGLHFRWFEQTPAAADVDGDGRLDLVVLAGTAEGLGDSGDAPCQLVVLLGDGGGGFTRGPVQSIEQACIGLGSGDFDEDGAPDFVVPYGRTESPTALGTILLLTRPGGEFAVTQYRDQAALPAEEDESDEHEYPQVVSDVLVFDANGDQQADVAFVASTWKDWSWSEHQGRLHVFLGDGQGNLGAGSSRKVGMWAWRFSITAADYDEDGHTDVGLAVLRSAGAEGTIELPRILFGLGDGGFSEPVAVPGTEASADLHSADYNGDGHIDLITSGLAGPVHLYAGRGDGSFASPTGRAVGGAPYWISTLDFDLDGRLDLVAMTQNGLERFPLPPPEDAPGAPRVCSYIVESLMRPEWWTAMLDFDGDSDNDVVCGHLAGVVVFVNDGDACFRMINIELFPWGEYPSDPAFTLGDVNGDGLVDVLHARNSELRLNLQRSDGTWEPLPPLARTSLWPRGKIALEDANGDGRLDIVETGGPFPFTSIVIHVQDAGGGLSLLPMTSFEGEVLRFEDANADGCFDLWVSHVGERVGIMTGDCAGGFVLEHFVAGPPYTSAFDFVDMNLDGRNDFVTGNGIMLANASGGYDRAATFAGDDWYRLWVRELNGDGLPDVALAANEIVTLAGDGAGSVGPPQRAFLGSSSFEEPMFGDLVGDALPDLLVVNAYGPTGLDQWGFGARGLPGILFELTVTENISARRP